MPFEGSLLSAFPVLSAEVETPTSVSVPSPVLSAEVETPTSVSVPSVE
jgi:hypothetical protein